MADRAGDKGTGFWRGHWGSFGLRHAAGAPGATGPARGEAWAPPPEAFHVERVTDPFSRRETIGMWRHPATPFEWRLQAPARPDDDGWWQGIAAHYLQAVRTLLEPHQPAALWPHDALWARLTRPQPPSGDPGFAWLPITWKRPPAAGAWARAAQRAQPLGSFWVDKPPPAGRANPAFAGTLVLLAGNVDTGHQLQFGARLGARVVMRLEGDRVSITGASFVGLQSDHALRAVPPALAGFGRGPTRAAWRRVLGDALDSPGRVWITNLERRLATPDDHTLLVTGLALKPPTSTPRGTPAPAHRLHLREFVAEAEAAADGALRVNHIRRTWYLGSAAGLDAAALEEADAAEAAETTEAADWANWAESAEPVDAPQAADPTALLPFAGRRVPPPQARMLDPLPAGAPMPPLANALWQVRATHADDALGHGLLRNTVPAAAPAGVVALPSAPPDAGWHKNGYADAYGADQADRRARELFQRLRRWGIDPAHYFRFARLPLVLRVRPTMTWASDGELPNADVRPFAEPDPANGPTSGAADGWQWRMFRERLQLLVRFGSADPLLRTRLPAQGLPAATKAQYVSLAADPRWAWHEFGHVLAFAATGELELAFAHSAGDAMAAIVADAQTALPDLQARRFETYPWIRIPGRSHGRRAMEGYCWCGSRNRVRLDFAAPGERYRHGYFGEQLMSASLFRLYRCLGGDTVGTDASSVQTRRQAADYTLYLIVRALALLGPDTVASARSADQFVSALIEADDGSAHWAPGAPAIAAGRVHKLVRWAFEQQGLYATDRPDAVADGIGLPPAVDVFIADQRPGAEGGYEPVALRADAQAAWLAHPDALQRQGAHVSVTVGNRGQLAAAACRVRLWWWSAADGRWIVADQARDTAGPLQPQDRATVSFHTPALAQLHTVWLLAAVDTAADPSQLTSDGADAPPALSALLIPLVAHDNNLALAPR